MEAERKRRERPSGGRVEPARASPNYATLLERLSDVQRAIVAQRAIHEIFDRILAAANELIGDDVTILRLLDPDGTGRMPLAASSGAEDELLAGDARTRGIPASAVEARRLVVADTSTTAGRPLAPEDWAARGLRAGMGAPVYERGEVAGCIGTASRRAERLYSARDQQVLLSLAEHVSLALSHARALDDAAHRAFHDSLTGMPNRALFLDRLSHALARAKRSGTPVAVLFIDLDDFKTINDSLGHRAGDELLVTVAERLRRCLRPADTVARLGGDEFAVLLEEIGEPGDAARAAERVLGAIDEPAHLGGREVSVGASIGIAAGSSEPETLLRDADLAMYRAKAEGKNRYEAFEPKMHEAIVERLELEVDLLRAIERGELELAFQPIFAMGTGAVAGLEALVRWRHPTRGLLAPNRFIPMAESSGRIAQLGMWVLREACHQGALWRAKYPAMPGIKIGVNVSAAQLRDPEFVSQVGEVLESTQLDPEGLTLEVTETVLMDDLDLEAASARLCELKTLGVEIAIDDFGVGHASLRYLRGLPLDNLKIARTFVDEIEAAGSPPKILRAIVELADVFALRAVAEGIERPEQRECLLALGCELGQGHLLSEPLPAAAADDLILRAGLLGDHAAREAERQDTPRRDVSR